MNRKRLNLTLRITDYEYMKKLASEYGFNNACGFVTEVLSLFLNYSKNPPTTRKKLPTISEEITQMFNELLDYEQTPANTLPGVRHLNRGFEQSYQTVMPSNTDVDDTLLDIDYLEDNTTAYIQPRDEITQDNDVYDI